MCCKICFTTRVRQTKSKLAREALAEGSSHVVRKVPTMLAHVGSPLGGSALPPHPPPVDGAVKPSLPDRPACLDYLANTDLLAEATHGIDVSRSCTCRHHSVGVSDVARQSRRLTWSPHTWESCLGCY
jgi:hypothetical protein